jgi:hypothetical protein
MAIEGRFIIAEGNSDHLFRPGDFVKEDAVQLVEGQFIHGSDEHLFHPEDFEKQEAITD